MKLLIVGESALFIRVRRSSVSGAENLRFIGRVP